MSSVENNAKPVGSTTSNGILLTTSDAYTLTDGPTIFLTEDVKKIGSFYIQQSNIDSNVFKNILNTVLVKTTVQVNLNDIKGKPTETVVSGLYC
jgi:hypothetical protein